MHIDVAAVVLATACSGSLAGVLLVYGFITWILASSPLPTPLSLLVLSACRLDRFVGLSDFGRDAARSFVKRLVFRRARWPCRLCASPRV